MNKITSLILLVLLFVLPKILQAQDAPDSFFNTFEKPHMVRYIKKNARENVCDYYENDTLKFKIGVPWHYFIHWNVETKFQEIKYRNGPVKSRGNFLVFTADGYHWGTPINQHLHYRKNGKLHAISSFTKHGHHGSDSLFNKNGKFKKVRRYSEKEQT